MSNHAKAEQAALEAYYAKHPERRAEDQASMARTLAHLQAPARAAAKVTRFCACGCPVDAQGVCQASACEAEDAERGVL